MKCNKIILTGMICFFVVANISAQKIGEKVYKEFSFKGETISKWFEYSRYKEYNEKGELIIPGEKFDEHGNKIYYKSREGEGRIQNDYDNKGNLIHKKVFDSDGLEGWYDYNNKGKKIHQIEKFSVNGQENEKWFDDNGNEIHWKSSSGMENWTEYNSDNKPIHCKDNRNSEWWRQYDKYGNQILHKTSFGLEVRTEYKYDSKGRVIYSKETRSDSSNTTEKWFDEWGHNIRSKYGDSENIMEYECDINGNPLVTNWNNKEYRLYEYTFWENGKIKTEKSFFAR